MKTRFLKNLFICFFALICFLFALNFSLANDVQQVKERSEISPEYKWKLEDIYSSDSLWEKDYKAVQNLIPVFKAFGGKLDSSPRILLLCLTSRIKLINYLTN